MIWLHSFLLFSHFNFNGRYSEGSPLAEATSEEFLFELEGLIIEDLRLLTLGDEFAGRSLTCYRPDFLEDFSCKSRVELRKSIFEHPIEYFLIEEHVLNVFFKSFVVRFFVKFQGLDSLDELLDTMEHRIRVLFGSKFLFQLQSFRSIVLVRFPRNLLFVD